MTGGGLSLLHLQFLLIGAAWTVCLSLIAFVGGGIAGGAIALARISPIKAVRWLAIAWIQLIQGTPLLVVLFVCYFGLSIVGFELPGLVAGVVDLMEVKAAEKGLALAMAVLLTNRGVPLIYYGDEIGLAGAGDPDNRRFMDWNTAGYNTGQRLLLDRHKKLGQLRKAHPALRRGTRTTLSLADDTWAYSMVEGSDTVYVLLNRSDGDKTVGGLPAGSYTDQVTGATVTGPTLTVPPRSFRILTK